MPPSRERYTSFFHKKQIPLYSKILEMGLAILGFFSYNTDERLVSNMSNKPKNSPNEMDEDYGATFITLTSEDGDELELEYLDTLEYNGNVYMAFFPTVPEGVDPDSLEDEEEYGLILMKVIEVDGEEQLTTLDSDEEIEDVYQQFMETLFEDEEE